jgi:hypothetical protein
MQITVMPAVIILLKLFVGETIAIAYVTFEGCFRPSPMLDIPNISTCIRAGNLY